MKAPGAQMIASVTFIAILMTILIQASTTEWLGRKLGLLEEPQRLMAATEHWIWVWHAASRAALQV